ncbi:hypothetical protein [Rufibacter immobilis]|uniref:hypothetical protein n=1 Tax=Rufibacter immobilis TaxID=1348778 RepID=UPI0035EFD6C0
MDEVAKMNSLPFTPHCLRRFARFKPIFSKKGQKQILPCLDYEQNQILPAMNLPQVHLCHYT